MQDGLVHRDQPLVPDRRAPVARQPREGPLHLPAVTPGPVLRRDSLPRDAGRVVRTRGGTGGSRSPCRRGASPDGSAGVRRVRYGPARRRRAAAPASGCRGRSRRAPRWRGGRPRGQRGGGASSPYRRCL
jgi:hypothetical protein